MKGTNGKVTSFPYDTQGDLPEAGTSPVFDASPDGIPLRAAGGAPGRLGDCPPERARAAAPRATAVRLLQDPDGRTTPVS
ncbi:hypothetical protein [Streptomyces lavendulocolor]|uniref:hypothetical protein n=1 Tax=Streptomyces lavendulocolor TaxID=67316 RepID=UPI003C2EC377